MDSNRPNFDSASKGLSLGSAIKHALLLPQRKPKDRKQIVKTLIDTFRYPRKGPGMMWEACASKICNLGSEVLLDRRVSGCRFDSDRKVWLVTTRDANGQTEEFCGENLVSSMPIRELVAQIEPTLSQDALLAALSLRYRDFLTVGLIVRDRGRFTDNWIYIHDPAVQVGRVQNYKSWSPEMVPGIPARTRQIVVRDMWWLFASSLRLLPRCRSRTMAA